MKLTTMYSTHISREERKAYKAFRSHLTADLKDRYGKEYTAGILYGDRMFLTAKDVRDIAELYYITPDTKVFLNFKATTR